MGENVVLIIMYLTSVSDQNLPFSIKCEATEYKNNIAYDLGGHIHVLHKNRGNNEYHNNGDLWI